MQSEPKGHRLAAPHQAASLHWLDIDLTPYLHYPLRLQIQGWHGPNPFTWRSFDYGEPLAEGSFLETLGIPLPSSLYRDIPPAVESLCHVAAPWRYGLLQACARFPAALELAREAPLLLILAVEYAQRMGWSEECFSACLVQKQPAILAAIDLSGSASLARLLRRMSLIRITSPLVAITREALQRPETLKLLRHHARPSLNHIWLIHRFKQEALWPGLLEIVDGNTPMHEMIWLRRMSEDIRRMAPNTDQLYRTRTRQALQQLHDRLVERFNSAHRHRNAHEFAREHGDYPEAPIRGNNQISPLDSWAALLLEGDRMHHCIGSYAARVAARQVFIYHMDAPEAVTIALTKRGNHWDLEDARGYCNALPSTDSLEAIHRWLTAY